MIIEYHLTDYLTLHYLINDYLYFLLYENIIYLPIFPSRQLRSIILSRSKYIYIMILSRENRSNIDQLLGYSDYGDIYEKIDEKKSTLKKPKCVKWPKVTILTVLLIFNLSYEAQFFGNVLARRALGRYVQIRSTWMITLVVLHIVANPMYLN